MFTKPDLLFIKNEEEVTVEEPELSVAKKVHEEEEIQQQRIRRGKARYYDNKNPLIALNSDLINAFAPPVAVFTNPAFAKDLNLELIVNMCFDTKFTQQFQDHVLSHAPVDIATIQYRWEILDELTTQESFVKTLEDLVLQFVHIYKNSLKRHEQISTFGLDFALITERQILELLATDYSIVKEYVEAVKAMHHTFEHAQSRGLQQLRTYAERIMETDDFKELDEMIKRYDNTQYVELGITSTAVGNIHRVRYLAEGKNQLPRSFLKSLHPRHLPKAVRGFDAQIYNQLLVRAFEGFITKMEQQILNTIYLIGDFEFYTGAMKYHRVLLHSDLPTTRPTLQDKSVRRHRIKKMYHPLLPLSWHIPTCHGNEFWIHKERVVPNSFESEPEHNLFLVTGPNNGGKTRYSTAVGLVYCLGQSGLWVPAEEAEISLVDNLFTHFVSGDDAANSSGRWVGEIGRMRIMLSCMTPYSLSLIDDFGSGTNYLEAREPALNVIYGHYRLGATLIMNTHLHQLAEDAESGLFPGISNWQMEMRGGLQYTYRVIPGRSGRSYASDIAERHGFSRETIDAMIESRTAQGELPAELVLPANMIEIPR